MKITLELPPDVEAQLRESATRYDADAVRRLLVEAFTPTVEALLRELPDALTDTEFEAVADQLADELTACRRSNAPVLSDYDVESDELRFCLDLAVEMRQRVVEQLQAIAPKEFQKVRLGFEVVDR